MPAISLSRSHEVVMWGGRRCKPGCTFEHVQGSSTVFVYGFVRKSGVSSTFSFTLGVSHFLTLHQSSSSTSWFQHTAPTLSEGPTTPHTGGNLGYQY